MYDSRTSSVQQFSLRPCPLPGEPTVEGAEGLQQLRLFLSDEDQFIWDIGVSPDRRDFHVLLALEVGV